MTADEERNQTLNVDGTRHVVELANVLEVGCLHHVSSVAVAGKLEGVFREDMFDEGQPLPAPVPPDQVRGRAGRPRREPSCRGGSTGPSIVVGHSETGEMDKIDGPYYTVRPDQAAAQAARRGSRSSRRDLGATNIVPVDYVADAMDAHRPRAGPRPPGVPPDRAAPAAGRRRLQRRRPCRAARRGWRSGPPGLPAINVNKGALAAALRAPQLAPLRRLLLSPTGIPDEVVPHLSFAPVFDARRAEQALNGSGIAVPRLRDYAATLWDFWERNLDPALHNDHAAARRGRRAHGADHGRVVRDRRGDRAEGRRCRGGTPLLVARTRRRSSRRCSARSRRTAAPRTSTRATSTTSRRSTSWPRRSPASTASTWWSTTPGARSAGRSSSASTASTTSSGRCSSTTSARSAW